MSDTAHPTAPVAAAPVAAEPVSAARDRDRPDFLIVGAMKAGTTTVYRDLSQHPDIFLPRDKEPETLVRLSDEAAIRAEYRTLFDRAKTGQIVGEASTGYTKMPDHSGIAARAHALCGPDLRILYMRRDPVARAFSQYQHELEHGTIRDMDFPDAVRAVPRLIDYGRYDWQIAPWIDRFGADNVLIVDLEDYSADRRTHLARILNHLGVDAAAVADIDVSGVANRADEAKTIGNPVLRALVYSSFYQQRVKGLMSDKFREKLRTAILPAPKARKADVDDATAAYIRAEIHRRDGEDRQKETL